MGTVPEGNVLYHYSIFILPSSPVISVSGRVGIQTQICVSLRPILFLCHPSRNRKVGHHGGRTKVVGRRRSSGRASDAPQLGVGQGCTLAEEGTRTAP